MLKENLSLTDQDYKAVVDQSVFGIVSVKDLNSKLDSLLIADKQIDYIEYTSSSLEEITLDVNPTMSSIAFKSIYVEAKQQADDLTVDDLSEDDKYQLFIEEHMDIEEGESYIKPYSLVADDEGNFELTLLTINKQNNVLEVPVLPIKIKDNDNKVILQEFLPVNIYSIPYQVTVNKVFINKDKILEKDYDLSSWDAKFESA